MYALTLIALAVGTVPALYILFRFVYIPPDYVVVTKKRGSTAQQYRLLPTGLVVLHPYETPFKQPWENEQSLISLSSRHYNSDSIAVTMQDGACVNVSFLIKYSVVDAGLWVARESSPIAQLQKDLEGIVQQKACTLQFHSLFHTNKDSTESVLCRAIYQELSVNLSILGATLEAVCVKEVLIPNQVQSKLSLWLDQKTAESREKQKQKALQFECERIKALSDARAEADLNYIRKLKGENLDEQLIHCMIQQRNLE